MPYFLVQCGSLTRPDKTVEGVLADLKQSQQEPATTTQNLQDTQERKERVEEQEAPARDQDAAVAQVRRGRGVARATRPAVIQICTYKR
jgi:hypothetical protein